MKKAIEGDLAAQIGTGLLHHQTRCDLVIAVIVIVMIFVPVIIIVIVIVILVMIFIAHDDHARGRVWRSRPRCVSRRYRQIPH